MHNTQPVQPVQQQQVLTFPLPSHKLLQILPLSQSTLMLITHTYKYLVIRLTHPSSQSQFLAQGSLPRLANQVQRYDRSRIIYVIGNRLQILDWVHNEVIVVGAIGCSGVYRDLYAYWLGEEYVLFWRESYLRYQLNYNYEIQLYKRDTILSHSQPTKPSQTPSNTVKPTNTIPSPKHQKKYKHQSPNSRKLLILPIDSAPEIVLCEIRGFAITVYFLQRKLSHTINSIYKLLLVWAHVESEESSSPSLHIGFTHSDLPAETMLCYELTPYAILERYYKPIPKANQIVYNRYCTFVLPDLIAEYGSRTKDRSKDGKDGKGLEVGMRRRYGRWVKYGMMLEAIFGGNRREQSKEKRENDKDKDLDVERDGEGEGEAENTNKQQDQKQQEKVPVGLFRLVIQMTQN